MYCIEDETLFKVVKIAEYKMNEIVKGMKFLSIENWYYNLHLAFLNIYLINIKW